MLLPSWVFVGTIRRCTKNPQGHIFKAVISEFFPQPFPNLTSQNFMVHVTMVGFVTHEACTGSNGVLLKAGGWSFSLPQAGRMAEIQPNASFCRKYPHDLRAKLNLVHASCWEHANSTKGWSQHLFFLTFWNSTERPVDPGHLLILSSYIGSLRNHCKDPYEPIRISWFMSQWWVNCCRCSTDKLQGCKSIVGRWISI